MARKIVIIDDEEDLVLMMAQALELRGFEVHSAYDGKRGLELVEQVKPDAVITDLMMPGMSGLEVCKTLRAAEETKDLPIVVISGLGAESDKSEEFWAAGLKSDDFISKPFEPAELLGRLEFVLRKSQYVSTQTPGGPAIADPAESAARASVPLEEATPKTVVKTFIESWNAQDFESEYKCMDPALTGGLGLSQYIGRRRQIFAEDSANDRRQEFVKVESQSLDEDEATLVCHRQDIVSGRARPSVEEYRLKKGDEGWKIISVRKAS